MAQCARYRLRRLRTPARRYSEERSRIIGAPIFLDCVINNVDVGKALVDTGAMRSIIDSRLFDSVTRTLQESGENPPRVLTWNNSEPLNGIGGRVVSRRVIAPELQVQSIHICHPLIVVERSPFPLILGMDILVLHRMELAQPTESGLTLHQCPDCYVCEINRIEERGFNPPVEHPVQLVGDLKGPLSTIVECAETETPRPMIGHPPRELSTQCGILNPGSAIHRLFPAREYREGTLLLVEDSRDSEEDSPGGLVPTVTQVQNGQVVATIVNGHGAEPLELHSVVPTFTLLQEETLIGAVGQEPQAQRENRVQEIISEVCEDLSEFSTENRAQLEHIIEKYAHVFAKDDMDIGITTRILHEIDTGENRPIRQHPRRIPYGEAREEATKQVKELSEAGLIRPSNSPWAQPIVMVRKKDNSWRMCVDYRRVNSITRKDSFPLPRIDEALDALAGSKYYCTIDLVKGYHQIPVRPQDVEKTAFVTHDGLFEYTAMPFGLCNAPGTCQRLMYLVLEGLIGKECLSYIDDVLSLRRCNRPTT